MSIHNDALITTKLEDQTAKKRSRDEVDETELDIRPFTIRHDPSDPFARPQTFTPICLLSRAQLPLATLDPAQSGSRIFSADISALEHEDAITILIARDEREKRLYAIERVKRRTYALCRLAEWFSEDGLTADSQCVPKTDESQRKRQALQPMEKGQPWWSRAAVDLPVNAPARNPASLPQLAMRRVMEAPQKSRVSAPALPEPVETSVEPAGPSSNDISEATNASTLDPTEELARHYLDALYLSRTSLAYFTKAPLSRVRAAFSQSPDIRTLDLVEFLRGSILTSTIMDKKYRDGVPAIVKDLAIRSSESPEQSIKPKKKKRRKWKPKRDKGGFFVDEQDFIERWWRDGDEGATGPSSVETTDAGIRRRLPKIRIRETFLQIILVLEAMALETTAGDHETDKRDGPVTTESQNVETQDGESQGPKKSSSKKPQDLPALLETSLDKLCIWHSLEANSPTKKDGDDEVHDDLKSFCIEVIIPFYVSRIPNYATLVNKKLGGPSAPSPIKRKASSSRKPGEPAVRHPPPEKRSRQPLARVSTDTLNQVGKTRVPALHRSATDSETLNSLVKRESSRESSEVPMHSIPPAKPVPRQRQSLMHSISFSKREVDLSAVSQANEAKMRKKADVDEKLREAISTLKKPNRAQAVKDIAVSTDESFAQATAKAKTKTVGKQSVHVTATPRHVRTVKSTPRQKSSHASGEYVHQSRSSGTSYVPASSIKMMAQPLDLPASTPAVPHTGHRPRHRGVEDTPSRGFAKFMPPGLVRLPGTLESPVASRTSAAIQQTPPKPVRTSSLPATSNAGDIDITGTPLKASPAQSFVERSPNVLREQVEAPPKATAALSNSIYDTLGWDDHYEDLT